MGDKLAVMLPADMQLKMESSNLKAYGSSDMAVLLATAKAPEGVAADPRSLLDQTEDSLRQSDPRLSVVGRGAIRTRGNHDVQWMGVLMNLPGKGKVSSLHAIGAKGDQIITITQVMSGGNAQTFQWKAEAIVRSLADVR